MKKKEKNILLFIRESYFGNKKRREKKEFFFYVSVFIFTFYLLHVGSMEVVAGHGRTSVAVLFALRRRDRVPLYTPKIDEKKNITIRIGRSGTRAPRTSSGSLVTRQ